MTHTCKSVSCGNEVPADTDFCFSCTQGSQIEDPNSDPVPLSKKYPKYYKSVGDLTEVDVYAVHHLFSITDPSGCIHHASKKLLLSGVRTGGKSAFKDIEEARDTLTRWLALNEDSRP